jgi:hypothetical protein
VFGYILATRKIHIFNPCVRNILNNVLCGSRATVWRRLVYSMKRLGMDLYRVIIAQADGTLSPTSYKAAEQSTVEDCVTLDGVTLTHSLMM